MFAMEKGKTGNRIYSWKAENDLWFFIHLFISREDRYTLELAWNRNSNLPESLDTFYRDQDATGATSADGSPRLACRFRIGRLMDPPGDHWWYVLPDKSIDQLTEELRQIAETGAAAPVPVELGKSRIPGLVEDSLRQLVTLGVPYFQRIAKQFEVTFPACGALD